MPEHRNISPPYWCISGKEDKNEYIKSVKGD
jgi:hypothetical protein